jgi:hypothetical protein
VAFSYLQNFNWSQGVNFTNILRAAFVPIFLRQKRTHLKCKHKKLCVKLFCTKKAVGKMLVKFTRAVLGSILSIQPTSFFPIFVTSCC